MQKCWVWSQLLVKSGEVSWSTFSLDTREWKGLICRKQKEKMSAIPTFKNNIGVALRSKQTRKYGISIHEVYWFCLGYTKLMVCSQSLFTRSHCNLQLRCRHTKEWLGPRRDLFQVVKECAARNRCDSTYTFWHDILEVASNPLQEKEPLTGCHQAHTLNSLIPQASTTFNQLALTRKASNSTPPGACHQAAEPNKENTSQTICKNKHKHKHSRQSVLHKQK